MHIGKSYSLVEFVLWTRRKAFVLCAVATMPVLLFQAADWRWISLPWPVLALLGTAASFIVGFKNAQTYSRTLEAQQIWSAISSGSRYWGLICRDFPGSAGNTKELVYRHMAWLTALRYQLRTPQIWEASAHRYNFEYRRKAFRIPEQEVAIECELKKFLTTDELMLLRTRKNLPTALLSLQSAAIRELFTGGLPVLHHTEMQKTLKDLVDQQARAERLKNFPYPRQYAVINAIFVWAFALLLPFGMVAEFAKLNNLVTGALQGYMTWLTVPFSVLVAWMYVSLDQVGESTENPFEGGANDVPITQICLQLEIDLRNMLGEKDIPSLAPAQNNIIL